MKEALDGHFTLDFTQLRSDTSAHILTGKVSSQAVELIHACIVEFTICEECL